MENSNVLIIFQTINYMKALQFDYKPVFWYEQIVDTFVAWSYIQLYDQKKADWLGYLKTSKSLSLLKK